MPERHPTIWDKIDPALVASVAGAPAAATEVEDPKAVRRRRWFFRVLDVLGVTFWTYAFLRTFVGDADSHFVHRFVPALNWLVDFRFVVFLCVVAVISGFVKKWYPLIVFYIAFFPLVVLLWKIPRRLYKHGSWNIVVGVIHIVTAAVINFRYAAAFAALGAVELILVLNGTGAVFLIPAIVIPVALLLVGLYRSLRYSLVPARFVSSQRRLVDRFVSSEVLKEQMELGDLKGSTVERFDKGQVDKFLLRVSNGVLCHKAVYFWAHRIDEYRKSPAAIVFSALSIVWLLAMMVFSFSTANYGLYRLEHDEFSYAATPSLIKFVYYSFSSLYVNEITGLSPQRSAAIVLKIAAGFCGAVLAILLIVTVFLSYRQSRDDEAARAEIEEIRRRGEELDDRIRTEYEVDADEAFVRLHKMNHALVGVIGYFVRHIPNEKGDTSPQI